MLEVAFKALGKEHVDAAVIERLREWLDPKLRARAARYAQGDGLDIRDHQADLRGARLMERVARSSAADRSALFAETAAPDEGDASGGGKGKNSVAA